MRDEEFVCGVCGFHNTPLGYTARDHCANCLHSIHIDNNPGDRANQCLGILEPIEIITKSNGYKIVYQCQKCGQIKNNIAARDDNMDVIIDISSRNTK